MSIQCPNESPEVAARRAAFLDQLRAAGVPVRVRNTNGQRKTSKKTVGTAAPAGSKLSNRATRGKIGR